jgi:serine/threonine protein phosphatase PrpC
MTQALTLALDFAAATDIGCKRTNNEDSYGYDADRHLYVVCDGMGGNLAGEVASSMAVRRLIDSFAYFEQNIEPGSPMEMIENRLIASIFEANRVVREAGTENPDLHAMGTTLVCVCLDGNRAIVGNVGDSRAYLLRNGTCQQITLDHSLLDEEVRNGNMTPEMAAASNLQSVITRAIGVADSVEPDLFAAQLQANDFLLLASDGLTRYVKPDEIAQAASMGTELPTICNALIEHAKERGGADNITCILLHAVDMPAEAEKDSDTSTSVFPVMPEPTTVASTGTAANGSHPADEMDAFSPGI